MKCHNRAKNTILHISFHDLIAPSTSVPVVGWSAASQPTGFACFPESLHAGPDRVRHRIETSWLQPQTHRYRPLSLPPPDRLPVPIPQLARNTRFRDSQPKGIVQFGPTRVKLSGTTGASLTLHPRHPEFVASVVRPNRRGWGTVPHRHRPGDHRHRRHQHHRRTPPHSMLFSREIRFTNPQPVLPTATPLTILGTIGVRARRIGAEAVYP